ncbi:calpain family cysteine protease, partial [Ostertagia ostertagi]
SYQSVFRLYGCYENLVGGHLSDALQDVSGGVAETLNVAKFLANATSDASQSLFNNLKEAFDNEALIVAAIAVVLFAVDRFISKFFVMRLFDSVTLKARSKGEIEEALDCGLVKGHAYAVTAVRYVELDAKSSVFSHTNNIRIRMIRLQNPWGEKEWNGPWSDGSREWE